jgi:phage-related protein (TIGR01555 family)
VKRKNVEQLVFDVVAKIDAKREKAAPASEPAPVKAARKPVKIGDIALGRAKANRRRAINPFILANHPPSVFPKGVKPTMAQDKAINDSLDWAAQSIQSGLFEEGLAFLGYPYLAELAQRAEYRVISETLATEATRKWIKIEAAGDTDKTDEIKAIEAEFVRLKVQDIFREISEQDGFFGRSHLYIDTGEGDDRKELITPIGDGRNDVTTAKFKKGSLTRLKAVEPVWCYPARYNSNDPLAVDWYKPESWFVMGKELHASRLLTFVGREVPDMLKPAYSFGGLSMSQMAKPTVDNWLRTRASVSDLIKAFSVMVISTDMSEVLSGGGDEFFRRLDFFNANRDNNGIMAVNKDSEELTNVSAPLGTLDTLQAQSQEHMASVSRTPIVKLLGIQPAGLNASSEGEIKTWDDWVAAYQQRFFLEPLTRILGFAQMNLYGKVDPDITIAFEPLRQMTEKEIGEIDKAEAEADQIRIDTGVISAEEARRALAAKEDSRYAGIDVEDVPDLKEEEAEGLQPKGQKGSGGEGGDDGD